MVRELLDAAVKIAGSEAALGRLTGYSQNAIWQAKQRGSVSPKMAKAIDAATSGKIPKEKLRPDIFEDAVS